MLDSDIAINVVASYPYNLLLKSVPGSLILATVLPRLYDNVLW